jgi:hypothetical protein
MIMEYAHDEFCDMLFSLGTCNGRAGIAPREYALRYPGPCHADAVIFRQLGWLLRQIGSVMPTAQVNAVRSQIVLTPANENTITEVVDLESCDIAQKIEFPQRRVFDVLHNDQLHPYHYCQSTHQFPGDRM